MQEEFCTGFQFGFCLLIMLQFGLYFGLFGNIVGLLTQDPAATASFSTPTIEKEEENEKQRKIPVKIHENLRLECRMFPPNIPQETCEWANVILKQLLKQQLTEDINQRLKETLNLEFSNLEEKSKLLSYIYASTIQIGEVPPEIKSIKILPSDTAKRDLEFMGRMVYNGGFSMELHTQIQLYNVMEVHLKVGIIDCFGDISIRISAVPDVPTDFYIYFALAEDPQIRLDIQSVLGTFTDLTMIDQIISSTLKVVIKRLFVDPNGRRYRWSPGKGFNVEKISTEEKKVLAEKKKKKKNLGPVQGRLHFHVHEAFGLLVKDGVHAHDPYCVISFNRQIKKTKVLSKTCDPKWDEHFTFDVFDQEDSVMISVYERDRLGKDEFIGNSMVQFGSIPPDEKINLANLLKRKKEEDTGTIRFEMMFEPFQQNRTVVYSRDKDLRHLYKAFIDVLDINGLRKTDFDSSSEAFLVSKAVNKFKTSAENLSDATQLERSSSSGNLFRSGSDVMELFSPGNSESQKESGNSNTWSSKHSDTLSLIGKAKSLPKYFMTVKIIQARGLMACGKNGLSDPFAQVKIGKTSKKTKVMKGSLSPLWNESLYFELQTIPTEVLIEIYDWNRIRHEFMGAVTVNLIDIKETEDGYEHECLSRNVAHTLSNVQFKEKHKTPNPDITGEIEFKIDLDGFKQQQQPQHPLQQIHREEETVGSPRMDYVSGSNNDSMDGSLAGDYMSDRDEDETPTGSSHQQQYSRRISEESPISDCESQSGTTTPQSSTGTTSIRTNAKRVMNHMQMKMNKEKAKTLASNISTQLKNYLQSTSTPSSSSTGETLKNKHQSKY